MELRDYRRIASTLLHTHRCFPTDVRVSPDVFYSGLSEAKRTYVECFQTFNRTLPYHINHLMTKPLFLSAIYSFLPWDWWGICQCW